MNHLEEIEPRIKHIQKLLKDQKKALLQEIKKLIDKEIERLEKVDEESSSYKISALYDLRKLIKN